MNTELNSNHLSNSKSLYLRQHQNNPVNWFPYGPEALTKAQSENKPILLSIGYSSCHWCHVMNQESFNNDDVAKLLNDNFICIKVDREEFPDLDNYYQKAAQLFGSNGGWPLNAFLLPNMSPYFVGTYFPLKSKDSPNFPDLLRELTRAFNDEKEQVLKNAEQVTESIKNGNVAPEGKVQFEGHFPHPNGILEAVKEFRDVEWGGYGQAPKFPNYSFFEWGVEQMLEGMVSKEQGEFIINSLEKMLMGGLHDHARGGVHRYSTDEKWLVPHFEKMLYDQAGFLRTMNKLSLVYPTPLVIDSIINTLDYLEQEMLSDADSEGRRHFFSAQDADSEGVEGLYFTFTEAEFEDLLNRNDNDEEVLAKNMAKIKNWFQISSKGNFEHELNIVSLNPALKNEIYEQANWDIIRLVRRAILNERKDRMPPMTDNKGIASWNFMLISALCDLVQYSQIEIVKKIASNLLNSSIEGVFKTFLANTDHGLKMFHTTTLDSRYPYLEDFVTFAESQLRLYEISSNEVFKQNFKDAMGFIAKEFINGDQMKTRAKSTDKSDLLPNQDYNVFDASFKSMVATYIGLSRRASALFSDRSYVDSILMVLDNTTNTILKINPVNAGEALRSLSYPSEVYRVIKIPKGWIQKEDFLRLLPFFLPRFIFSYTDATDEKFEICSLNACEVTGTGYEEFKKVLVPQSAQNE